MKFGKFFTKVFAFFMVLGMLTLGVMASGFATGMEDPDEGPKRGTGDMDVPNETLKKVVPTPKPTPTPKAKAK